jgi:hypothetical protein
VTPEAPVRLHRIRNDQLYHYYLGDPLEVFMLGGSGEVEHIVVGPDIVAGQRVQLFIPGNTFHTARLVGTGRWFLGASTEWPGVVPTNVEIGNLEELAQSYPTAAPEMRAIAAAVKVMPNPGAALRCTSRRLFQLVSSWITARAGFTGECRLLYQPSCVPLRCVVLDTEPPSPRPPQGEWRRFRRL